MALAKIGIHLRSEELDPALDSFGSVAWIRIEADSAK
jgi:hypothetical protein